MESNADSFVAVGSVNNIDSGAEICQALFNILNSIKPTIKLCSNAVIVIKVNLCLLIGPETGGTVDPVIAKLLCRWFLENFEIKQIYLAEADATHLDADMAFRALGWGKVVDELEKVKFLNLSKDEQVAVKPKGATYLREIKASTTMMEADFLVSLAKLKTHAGEKITCIMKNQFGSLPYKYKIIYHKQLTEAICDAVSVRIPDLCVIDGLIAMEGNGPTNGIPKRTKLLLASNDPVSMDHFCARLMGFRPASVPHLKLAMGRVLGKTRYNVLGTSPDPLNLRFRFLPSWKKLIKNTIGLMQKGTLNEEA
jgi:uncharacterized protein (DUF362 family)